MSRRRIDTSAKLKQKIVGFEVALEFTSNEARDCRDGQNQRTRRIAEAGGRRMITVCVLSARSGACRHWLVAARSRFPHGFDSFVGSEERSRLRVSYRPSRCEGH